MLGFREIYETSFFSSSKRQKFAQIQKENPPFSVFKICIPLNAMCFENFGRFHQRKFRKITNAIKQEKYIYLGILIQELHPKF